MELSVRRNVSGLVLHIERVQHRRKQSRPTWQLALHDKLHQRLQHLAPAFLLLHVEAHLVASRQPDRHTRHREAMYKVGGTIDRVYYPRESVFGKLRRRPSSLHGCLLTMCYNRCGREKENASRDAPKKQTHALSHLRQKLCAQIAWRLLRPGRVEEGSMRKRKSFDFCLCRK